jgi:internalin A
VRLLGGEAIMARQRGTVGAGLLLGLLFLAGPGQADEAAAVKAIEKLGGNVTVDAKRPGKPVVGVSLFFTQVTDAGLKELRELKSLTELDLGFTAVTDVGLKELKELKSLQTLDLSRTKVTDAGLKAIPFNVS